MTFGCSDDATPAFIRVYDTHEVLICYVGEETFQWRILAPQDCNVPLLWAAQSLSLEAGELLPSVREPEIVFCKEDDQAARPSDCLVHFFDKARAKPKVVILDADLVTLLQENVSDLARNGGHRAPTAQEEVVPLNS